MNLQNQIQNNNPPIVAADFTNEVATPDVRASHVRQVRPSIDERFAQFHEENPNVYDLLVRFARQAKNAGRPHLGMAALFERARWYTTIETTGDHFKLNNDYRAPYARLIESNEADLQGFFTMRERREL